MASLPGKVPRAAGNGRPGRESCCAGVKRRKESHRLRHTSPTRACESRMRKSCLCFFRWYQVESPACPAPTITVFTASLLSIAKPPEVSEVIRIAFQSLECYSFFVEIRHNDRRLAQAVGTKAAVVEAARQLFLSKG